MVLQTIRKSLIDRNRRPSTYGEINNHRHRFNSSTIQESIAFIFDETGQIFNYSSNNANINK